MTDVADIAKSLTKAGAIILKRMRLGADSEAYYLRSATDVWSPAAALSALVRRGLVIKVPDTSPQRYRLTALGVPVRAHLKGNSHD